MKRNSQKKRNIHRSSLKQKKKVQHGGVGYVFKYNELIGDSPKYGNEYFVELLSNIIKKPDQVYDLLTLKESLSLEQFQNVLKTFFLTPRKIERTKKVINLGFFSESKTVAEFKTNTGITKISGLQMAILYGRYELIKDLFYYKLPDKEHSVITPDMYNSFYENINVIIETTPNVATSQPEEVANSNALHLVFTCGVDIKDTPFNKRTPEIAKLRHFSEMYLIKQLFHKINENWYKVIPETPQISETSQISPPDYDNMKNKLSEKLDTLKNTYVQNYISDSAKTNLTNIINKYLNVLNTQGRNAGTNIKNLYIDIVNNKEFTKAITNKTLWERTSYKQPTGKSNAESNAEQIKKYYENFFAQLEKDYLTIIDYEKDTHTSKLDNSKFLKEYIILKDGYDFLPEIENKNNYIDFVIYKQFMWNETKSILLPNAKDEIIKLNDTDYKLEYEGSLETVILPGTNEINNIKISNENIGEFKNINIITLSSKSTVTVNEEFIITQIDIPEKSTSSQQGPDTSGVGSQKGSEVTTEGPEVTTEGPEVTTKVNEGPSEGA